jgi:methyl-accepting chemotaxis protein
MTRIAHRTLLALAAAVLSITATISAPALAQPAAPAARASEPAAPADAMTAQDREILAAAEQLATDASQLLEQWIMTQAITEERLFARLYFPLPKTDPRKAGPQQFATPYTALADRDLSGPQEKALARVALLQYAILTDINGYVPVHNNRFAQALTGNSEQDYINNRTKRMLGDNASLSAARSETRYSIQRVKLETGDVIIDLSVPVNVRGKHWGCARIGYRRSE